MRIAVIQTPGTTLAEWPATLRLLTGLIERAAAQRAEFVVLPECAWPAYWLEGRDAYRAARHGGLPGPDHFLATIGEAARRHRLYICAGFVEEAGTQLFNAAALIDPAGRRLGTARKCFLWNFDHDVFEPGAGATAVDTPLGPVGLMICADARIPEIPAALAAQKVRLIVQPTAWVNAGTAERPWNPQPDFLIAARAIEFGVPVASASKWGREGSTDFVGSSLICASDGSQLAGCGQSETAVALAEVDLTDAKPPQITAAERATLRATGPAAPHSAVGRLELVFRVADAAPSADSAPGGRGEVIAAYEAEPAHGVRVVCPESLHRSVTTMDGSEAARFAPARCHALRAVRLVVVHGDLPARALLRARAAENRIYVAFAGRQTCGLIDPRGAVVLETKRPTQPGTRVTTALDLDAAADKCVAPRTNVLAGRRPELLAF